MGRPPRFARRDANERRLIEIAEAHGARWIPVNAKDAPDGFLGYRGFTVPVEVKNPEGFDTISAGQRTFHQTWPGSPVSVVRTEADLLALLADLRRKA